MTLMRSLLKKYWIFLTVILVAKVESEGTLHLTLTRYKNDTCGGYIDESDLCVYLIDLRVETSYWRGGTPVFVAKHYQVGHEKLPDEGNYYFEGDEIIFDEQIPGSDIPVLGSLPNPIPIPTVTGNVSVSFIVNNQLDVIFNKTYTFNTETMQPLESDKLSDFMSTGFVALRYTLQCEDNYQGLGCQSCSYGWHGNKCDIYCTETERYNCHPITGDKVCKEHHHGRECDVLCVSNDNHTCTDFGIKICREEERGCPPGMFCERFLNGRQCQVDCAPTNGTFLCNGLSMGWCYTGPNGSKVCRDCIPAEEEVHCTTPCYPDPPRYTCTSGGGSSDPSKPEGGERRCGTGWRGVECDECDDTWYGDQCQIPCNSTSREYVCNQLGEKICVGNWEGEECDSCKTHYYGDYCQVHCLPNEFNIWTCDPSTGQTICSHLRTGENCNKCIEDHYPRQEVADNVTCTWCNETAWNTCSDTGKFICKASWFGAQCTHRCVETDRYMCNSTDNGVKLVCKGNFAGSNCLECKRDYYGEDCDVYCLSDKVVRCDSNGVQQCRTNYYSPPDCRVYCNASSILYDCLSDGSKQCNGNRDITTDCTMCSLNYFGDFCEIYCAPTSRNSHCNSFGELVCKENWEGPNCDKCAEHWYGEYCYESFCYKTCDIWCQDLINFKCNREGILEMTTEHYSMRMEKYIDERTYNLIIGLVVAGLMLIIVIICIIMYLHLSGVI